MSASATPKTVRVAVTQAEPEWLDLAASVTKTNKLIAEAASNKAQLVAFPECWIPGYPCWIWSRPVDFELGTIYIKNSLKVDSPEMQAIAACAKEHNIAVMLGFSENDNNSLYISQALISANGEIIMRRRKVKPTHMERTVFGDGSGNSLRNVVAVPGVGRVGALACWEHTQPLLKYHTYLQREDIHVAAWPPLDPHPGGPALWSMSTEGCASLSQTYAVESASFVLHCTAVFTEKGIEAMGTKGGALFTAPGGGCSAVFGPDGRRLVGGEGSSTEEKMLVIDLDMDLILASRQFVDCSGHYSRPDLLWLGVDDSEKRHRIAREDGGKEKEQNLVNGSGKGKEVKT
jgi:nitrilase